MALAEDLHPSNYITSIALLLLGCLIQSIGVVLEIKPQVAMMSAEGFVNYAARRYNKEGHFRFHFSNGRHHFITDLHSTDRRSQRRLSDSSLHHRLYREFPEQ